MRACDLKSRVGRTIHIQGIYGTLGWEVTKIQLYRAYVYGSDQIYSSVD